MERLPKWPLDNPHLDKQSTDKFKGASVAKAFCQITEDYPIKKLCSEGSHRQPFILHSRSKRESQMECVTYHQEAGKPKIESSQGADLRFLLLLSFVLTPHLQFQQWSINKATKHLSPSSNNLPGAILLIRRVIFHDKLYPPAPLLSTVIYCPCKQTVRLCNTMLLPSRSSQRQKKERYISNETRQAVQPSRSKARLSGLLSTCVLLGYYRSTSEAISQQTASLSYLCVLLSYRTGFLLATRYGRDVWLCRKGTL